MEKNEAVKVLRDEGMEAELVGGVVIVRVRVSTIAGLERQHRQLRKKLKAAGYSASYGATSCTKEA